MPRNLVQPTALSKPASRIVRLAIARFTVALGLTSLDWFGFQFTRKPDIAPYLNNFDRVLLPVLFAGLFVILSHLWALTFLTFRSALRKRNVNHAPSTKGRSFV